MRVHWLLLQYQAEMATLETKAKAWHVGFCNDTIVNDGRMGEMDQRMGQFGQIQKVLTLWHLIYFSQLAAILVIKLCTVESALKVKFY